MKGEDEIGGSRKNRIGRGGTTHVHNRFACLEQAADGDRILRGGQNRHARESPRFAFTGAVGIAQESGKNSRSSFQFAARFNRVEQMNKTDIITRMREGDFNISNEGTGLE